MPEVKRGREAIEQAAENKGGGTFRPFLQSIFWKEDKEARYVLFLNSMDEMPTFQMIGYIPIEGTNYFAETVAKTDPAINQGSDAFVKDKKAKVRMTSVAIAVELEPQVELVGGRRKPVGFEVKTTEYTRKLVDEQGDLTGEEEEVTAPVVGFVAQSPNNFFNVIANYDNTKAPIDSTAVEITRIGKSKHTSYNIFGYEDQPVDLTNLLDYVEGVSYLKKEMAEVLTAIDGIEDDFEAAKYIGAVLLDKKIEELIDPERYTELYDQAPDSLAYNDKNKESGKTKTGNVTRTSRRSQRRSAADDDGTDAGTLEAEAEENTESGEKEEAPAPKARRARGTAGKQTPKERMQAIRSKAEGRKAA